MLFNNKATGQEAFLALLVLQGLTGIDTKGGGIGTTPLLPGLSITSQIPQTGPKTFSYRASAGETFDITVTAIDHVNLTATLHDVEGNADIITQQANRTGIAFIKYTATSDMDLEVLVTGNVTGNNTLFTLGLKSSISGCPANTANATGTPTGTPTQKPAPFTGGAFPAAVPSLEGWGILFTVCFLVLGYTAGAAFL
ncbi:MAG: hypothetical protein M1839_005709 [Geoglossum umbratile]|nr:MAG: hypothetical protein M1839_005709 [Geoglossum umbratile]